MSLCSGVNFLKNFLLRNETLLLPSIITLYCLCGNTSNMTPLLDQRRGLFPAWFCTITLSPTSKGACSFTLVDNFSLALADLFASASSLQSATSCQSSDRSLQSFNSGSWFGLDGRKSFNGRPRRRYAGDRPVSLSGVFL